MTIMAAMTYPPARFAARLTAQSRSSCDTVPLRATTAVTGARKFWVNNSLRESSSATKPDREGRRGEQLVVGLAPDDQVDQYADADIDATDERGAEQG
jgi:hypothetical protein